MTIRASKLLGHVVVDRHGERIGRLTDLLFEGSYPAGLCYALIDMDRAADETSYTVAVPWDLLDSAHPGSRVVVGVSRQALHRLRNIPAD